MSAKGQSRRRIICFGASDYIDYYTSGQKKEKRMGDSSAARKKLGDDKKS